MRVSRALSQSDQLVGGQHQHAEHQMTHHLGGTLDHDMVAAGLVLEACIAAVGDGALVVADGFVRIEFDLRSLAGVAIDQRHMPQAAAVLPNLLAASCTQGSRKCAARDDPRLVRGDFAFGVDPVMRELERMAQPYLFKLKQSAGVRRLIERLWRDAEWQDMGEGYHAVETRLALSGWEHDRRVIVVRRAVKPSLAVEANKGRKSKGQQSLPFANVEGGKLWEYAVLVTNSDCPLAAIGQLYRDRAACENGFDELKNQWGWGGYTTRDLERCNLSARTGALIYNWWSWYVRLAHPKARLEAITSRPLLLAGIARQSAHAGHTRLLVTLTHACADQVKTMIANVRKGLDANLASAPQLAKPERRRALVRYIIVRIAPLTPVHAPPSPPNSPPAPALAAA